MPQKYEKLNLFLSRSSRLLLLSSSSFVHSKNNTALVHCNILTLFKTFFRREASILNLLCRVYKPDTIPESTHRLLSVFISDRCSIQQAASLNSSMSFCWLSVIVFDCMFSCNSKKSVDSFRREGGGCGGGGWMETFFVPCAIQLLQVITAYHWK